MTNKYDSWGWGRVVLPRLWWERLSNSITQTQEFDYHARIKRLAEAEWECPGVSARFPDLPDAKVHNSTCCKGTGRIVPFAALRVPCVSGWHNYPKEGTQYPACLRCEDNRGWIPEPDEEKACWRIMEWGENEDGTAKRKDFRGLVLYFLSCGTSLKEAVLLAAEALLEEEKP